jgi:hypothetical protein
MKLFRERLLARLIERHAISEELARKLLAFRDEKHRLTRMYAWRIYVYVPHMQLTYSRRGI